MNDHAEAVQDLPGFLLLSLSGGKGQAGRISRWSDAIVAAGGRPVASGYEECNSYLEPGTQPKSVVIATWPSEAAVHAAWPEIADDILLGDGKADILALAGACLPEAGMVDFPTRENAVSMTSPGPAAYMVIEGTVTDWEPMARYRDIIFPMISARGGYYLVYASRNDIKILQGKWTEEALIVSRWPDAALPWDFWYCDEYQNLAIPTRTGAGKFSVILLSTE